MKWKIALGLGVACAACCVIPVTMVAGGLGLIGLSSGNAVGIAIGAALLGATGIVYWVQRRRAAALQSCATDGSCGCKPEGVKA